MIPVYRKLISIYRKSRYQRIQIPKRAQPQKTKKSKEPGDRHSTKLESLTARIQRDHLTRKVSATIATTKMVDPRCAKCVHTYIERLTVDYDASHAIKGGREIDPYLIKSEIRSRKIIYRAFLNF
jgi:hypothetical protein